MRLMQWIKRHAVAAYFVFTFAWSWLWWTGYAFLPGEDLFHPSAAVLAFFLLGGCGPSLFGIVLTEVVDSRAGLPRLLARVRDWRVGWRWYGAALGLAPALLLATRFLWQALGFPLATSPFGNPLAATVGIGVSAALIEEFGWRGYALPRLMARRTPLVASLILGVLWGAWHVYPNFWVNFGSMGWLFWPSTLINVAEIAGWAMLMTWVLNRTRLSMVMAILLHASFTGSQVALLPALGMVDGLLFHGIFAGLIWLAAGVVVVLEGVEFGERRLADAKPTA